MKTKFIYTGWVQTEFRVEAENYRFTMRIAQIEDSGKFEVYANGCSYGVFPTFGKALSFAETKLKTIIKNNPE